MIGPHPCPSPRPTFGRCPARGDTGMVVPRITDVNVWAREKKTGRNARALGFKVKN
jgi:hypothetical protein